MGLIVVEATAIPDVKVVTPQRFGDRRGFFSEVYNRQDFAAVGRLSIRKLLRKVSDPAFPNDTTIVPTELVIRRSTAAPAAC